MKRKVSTIGTKRIVQGDPNLVTEDEILLVEKPIDLVAVSFVNESSEQVVLSLTDSVGPRKVNVELDRPIVANMNIMQSGKSSRIRCTLDKSPLSVEGKKFNINFTVCYDNKLFASTASITYEQGFTIPLPSFEVGASVAIRITNQS
nr:MAG TPA: hypothetical protein [Crassvirales sp.]